MAGVESNPGPAAPGVLKLGALNAHSAVNKAPLIHDMIDERRLDLLVVTETWMVVPAGGHHWGHRTGWVSCAPPVPRE